jgi:hypothetical protein
LFANSLVAHELSTTFVAAELSEDASLNGQIKLDILDLNESSSWATFCGIYLSRHILYSDWLYSISMTVRFKMLFIFFQLNRFFTFILSAIIAGY